MKCKYPQGREVFSSLHSRTGKKKEDISGKGKEHGALIKHYHCTGLAKKNITLYSLNKGVNLHRYLNLLRSAQSRCSQSEAQTNNVFSPFCLPELLAPLSAEAEYQLSSIQVISSSLFLAMHDLYPTQVVVIWTIQQVMQIKLWLKLEEHRYRLDIRKKFFSMIVELEQAAQWSSGRPTSLKWPRPGWMGFGWLGLEEEGLEPGGV